MRRSAVHVLVLLLCALACACRGRGAEDGAPADPPPVPPEGPAIRAVSPSQGPLAGGTLLRIEGSGFLDDEPAWVRIGERLVVTPALADDLLEVPVPPGGEPGPVGVGVVTAKGRAWSEDAFAYAEAPGILAFIPAVGFHDPLFGGTRITIHVTNHPPLATPRVVFGGVDAASVTVVDDRTLCAEVPEGFPPGTEVDIEVEDGWTLVATGFLVQCALRPGDLVVNEFLANAGSADANGDDTASAAGDEFVEIANRRNVPVDLSGFAIHDATALRHRFPNPTTVPAGGAIVVFGYGNPKGFAALHASGHAQVASSGGLGLNNGGDTIRLVDAGGSELFSVRYTAGDVEPGVSRQNPIDGCALPPDARGSDYVAHDGMEGAIGPLSPGRRIDGTPFEQP